MRLILASQSPRRRELMGLFHRPFTVCAANIDEAMDRTADPAAEVARVSLAKALAIPRQPEDVVVAADTIVVCDGQILGKPKTRQDAIRMLQLLSGRDHQVMTGLSVLCGDRQVSGTEVTHLYFCELTQRQIEEYVDGGEPMDKAGAYGIQGGAALFCPRMEGDYYNVMGLPVCRLGQILRELAPQWMEGRA